MAIPISIPTNNALINNLIKLPLVDSTVRIIYPFAAARLHRVATSLFSQSIICFFYFPRDAIARERGVNAGALYVKVGSYFIYYHRSYVNDGGLYVNAGASYVNAGRYLLTAGGSYIFYGRHFLLYGGYLLNWGHYSINAGQCFTN